MDHDYYTGLTVIADSYSNNGICKLYLKLSVFEHRMSSFDGVSTTRFQKDQEIEYIL